MQEAAIKRDAHPSTSKVGTQLKDIKKTLPLRVLSEDDWQHWITKGYVIVRQAVPRENVERLVELLWEFDEKDPKDPATWYAPQRRELVDDVRDHVGRLSSYRTLADRLEDGGDFAHLEVLHQPLGRRFDVVARMPLAVRLVGALSFCRELAVGAPHPRDRIVERVVRLVLADVFEERLEHRPHRDGFEPGRHLFIGGHF